MNEICIGEHTKNTIFRVKRKLSTTKKVSKCNQIESVKEVVEEHISEPWHIRNLHTLIEIDRAY